MSVSGVALVTGATTGIGRETSLALARAGHAVVVSGRRKEAGEAVACEVRDNGGEAAWPTSPPAASSRCSPRTCSASSGA
ncbi:SDR family NAD(P)-dependent oxidoreductase [Kitasatospora sp. NPDC001132]